MLTRLEVSDLLKTSCLIAKAPTCKSLPYVGTAEEKENILFNQGIHKETKNCGNTALSSSVGVLGMAFFQLRQHNGQSLARVSTNRRCPTA